MNILKMENKDINISKDIVTELEKVNKTNNTLDLPDFIKPCVSLILNTPFSKGDLFSRNDYCYLIFVELRRIGITKEKARIKIDGWNDLNNPPLPESEIRGCLKSAYKKYFTFGCNNPKLLEFCENLGGKKSCHYYIKIAKKSRKYSEYDYTNYGWQKILTPRECYVLFYIIPFIEKNRGYNPGSRLNTSCRELAQLSGINQRYFSHDKNNKNILNKLKIHGLIEYIPGKRHKWNKTANQIKRIIPVPIPPKCKQGKY